MGYYTKEIAKRYFKIALGQTISPVLLNILITSVCDMRCTHCFYTDELDDKGRKAKMMTLREIERISETLGGNLGVLIIAGGEPFTRKDLVEVAQAFYKNNHLNSLYLMSNGQFQDRILSQVSRVLDSCPGLHVTVAMGIDGLKEEHEKIRQKEGSWDCAIDTVRKLQEIKKEHPQLDIQTCTCFMNSNQDRIFDWYQFLRNDLKPDKVNMNYIRPPSANLKELEIDLERYHALARRIDQDSRAAAVRNTYGGKEGCFEAAVDIYMHDLIAATVREGKPQLRCWAGSASAVIYDEGTLSTCENLDPIGNLRDYDWNFQGIWNGQAMKERRLKVKNGCHCTHESNCYYPSLPLNPRHLYRIKKLERKLKVARKKLNASNPS